MMVGKKISLDIERSEPKNPTDRLTVKNVSCMNREGVKVLDGVSFTARSGEILGIAGIAGSGRESCLRLSRGFSTLRAVKFCTTTPRPARRTICGTKPRFR